MSSRSRAGARLAVPALAFSCFAACTGTAAPDAGAPDLGTASTGDMAGAFTCAYAPLPATAGAGGKVTAGALTAGTAEVYIDLPVGSALGGFSARGIILGNQGAVDNRKVEYSGQFNPSSGIETRQRVRALALAAGGEHLVILKVDAIFAADSITDDVADALGPDYAGKVVFSTSHSHSMFEQYSPNTVLAVGGGRFRKQSYDRMVTALTTAAKQAIAAQVPAKVGLSITPGFDPMNVVSHDRRGENDKLAGGSFKDDKLGLLRVDTADDKPLAVVAVFGVHGTVLDADNALSSADAPGAVESALEESFDGKVLAIHLQGAAGDVSPSGMGGVTKASNDPGYNFARAESVGLLARPMILAAYHQLDGKLKASVPMEMLTRSVPLGPDPKTFTIRSGALAYAPWDVNRPADRVVWTDPVKFILASPIDEFNAPVGAGLCGDNNIAFIEGGAMNNVQDLTSYSSCARVDAAADFLGRVINLPFEPPPLCASTRTTVSAIRIDDHLIATIPGEPVTLLADKVRALSPWGADKTIVVGYSQGHIGYVLTPEDWLQGGYEPSINLWGPLEGEYLAERAADLMKLAVTDDREDAAKDGVPRMMEPAISDQTPPVDFVPPADPAPMAGTVPTTIPAGVYLRTRIHPASAQPAAQVQRWNESARFVWIGEDPLSGTPVPTLQRESPAGSGTYVDVTRRSGRPVQDRDLLMFWTPDPLQRPKKSTTPRTHYWAVEWQAATWTGGTATGDAGEDLEARAGVPLGKYRFHVAGTGYTLDSQPFEVVAGPLEVGGKATGSRADLTVSYHANQGYRLITLDGNSNEAVGLSKDVHVDLTHADGSVTHNAASFTSPGVLSVDDGNASALQSAKVTDSYGNSGAITF